METEAGGAHDRGEMKIIEWVSQGLTNDEIGIG
jgi:DNA-binding CsgD family transcriptional regulator